MRGLLADQHPDLAALPLREFASGWDNLIYRLGDALCVRLPRRQLGADLVVHEQTWLPRLAPSLPLPVPAPLRTGEPGRRYPWRWSICPWLPGEPAATSAPRDPFASADRLGAFSAALHRPAPTDAPRNAFRGGPLQSRNAALDRRVEQLGAAIDAAAVRALWARCLALPHWSKAPVWLHGDLHPANLLVHEGVLSAVIDLGDISAGDPATDLAIAWMLFEPSARQRFRSAAGDVDDATWGRAQGWALQLALAFMADSADEPVLRRIGEATLDTALGDDGAA
ncbi:MAG: aminoglycoside phosphotransferase family protein [Deltaproteobacteria bacterium]|nr:aminoglycoside phosphotransferase family protein [Deltaproteobacteria bacterium]MBW2360048.1 aminoglycoside phosphotransferase family protein [Deltaproteobacteria bacterium]